MPKIFLFGFSANPPHCGHRIIAQELTNYCDRFVVIPCGGRPDKQSVNNVSSVDRAVMTDLTFSGLSKVEIDLSDLEKDFFTPTYILEKNYCAQGEVWHVVGSDLVRGGRENSEICCKWYNGPQLWQNSNFAIVIRRDCELINADLPPHHQLFNMRLNENSTGIRQRAFNNQDLRDRVSPLVEDYILRKGLYTRFQQVNPSRMKLNNWRLLIEPDEWNPAAKRLAKDLQDLSASKDKANLILTIGGDSTMLKSIRKHWRKRLPFFGWNLGHVGYLLNEVGNMSIEGLKSLGLEVYQSPLLKAELISSTGRVIQETAFNDFWVHGVEGKITKLSLTIDGTTWITELVGDGLIVSTAAGSTGYAWKAGGVRLPFGSPQMLLTGIAAHPFTPTQIELNSVVEINVLDAKRWPMIAFADGLNLGEVRRMTVSVSKIGAPELAFLPGRVMSKKALRMQFGNGGKP